MTLAPARAVLLAAAAVPALALAPRVPIAAQGTAQGEPAGAASARADLLEGVEAIAAPGTPGEVVAFGPSAFAVVCDPSGAPVVAASLGEGGRGGRALVLGHGGYFEFAALEREDTARLLSNAVRWLAGGKRRPRVAVLSERTRPLVAALGLPVEVAGSPPRADVLVLAADDALPRARQAELEEFVRDGGGLLGAGTGWGWLQVHRDDPGGGRLGRGLGANRLLAPLGLAFGARTAGEVATADGEGRLPVGPVPPLAHAGAALEALRANELPGHERQAAAARVVAAIEALDDHEPRFVLPLRAALEGSGDGDGEEELRRELGPALAHLELRPLAVRFSGWWLLGPLASPRGDVTRPGPVEERLERFAEGGPGPDAGREQRGLYGRTGWRPLEVAGDGRALDVGAVRLDPQLGPPADLRRPPPLARVTAYLAREVVLEEPLERALVVESSGGLRLWVDGELMLDRPDPTAARPEDQPVELRLDPGRHHLLVKLAHEAGALRFRLAPAGDGLPRGAVDAAVDRAVAHLVRHQLLDGSWAGYEPYGPGLTALVLHALLKSGRGPDDPVVRRAAAYVGAHEAVHTYSLSPGILAALELERGDAGGPSPATRELVERLVATQEKSGLYAYPVHPDGHRAPDDLSTTLFAALALRAAADRGLKVPDAVWSGLLEGTLRCWRGDAGDEAPAGFSYRTRDEDPGGVATGSMTGAGISVLTIARTGLERRVERGLVREVEAALASARAWLEARMVFDSNPGAADWHFFHLYGIERAGELLGVEYLGGLPWYREGARYLLERQRPDGAFEASAHAHAERDTALALLFLKRATRPSSGPGPGAARAHQSAGGGQVAVLAASGGGPYEVWIADWLGLDPSAVRSVRYLASQPGDEGPVELALARPRAEAPVQRFEARVEPPAAGAWTLVARIELEGDAGTLEVDSGAVELLHEPDDPAALDYAAQGRANLLRGRGLEFEASSQAGAPPAAAADGRQSSWWSAAPEDRERRWQVGLARSVTARRLLLSHAAPSLAEPGRARAAAVEVEIDGEALGRFELDPDPRRKTVIDLGGARRVRSLELRLAGPAGQALGLAEVELLD